MSRIFLVGFMGVGKSTVGKQLAKTLGYKHIDIDSFFEHKYKINIDQFFNKYGQSLFRKIEYNLLKNTFDYENTVISTGGGTVATNDAMALMNQNGVTIFLEMSVEGLHYRLSHAKKKRPLIESKNESELFKFIECKLAERLPHYAQAHLKVNAIDIDVQNLAKQIKEME